MSNSVSVVIPTYNGSALVRGGLESIFAQTLLPREIIVVDDFSTDDTLDVVKSIASTAPVPLSIIRLPKNTGGPARPLNVGIENATGDFISVLEQDDLMRPRRIEKQLNAALKYPECSIVVGRFCIVGSEEGDMSRMWPVPQFAGVANDIEAESEFFTLGPRAAFTVLLNRNFAGSNSNFCFSKRWWKQVGGFNERVRTYTDLDFMFKAVLSAPVVVVNEVLLDFSWRADSLHRRNVEYSFTEATILRLKFAAAKPDWAGDNLQALQQSIRTLALSALRQRNLAGLAMIGPSLIRHGALRTILKRKARHYMSRLLRIA